MGRIAALVSVVATAAAAALLGGAPLAAAASSPAPTPSASSSASAGSDATGNGSVTFGIQAASNGKGDARPNFQFGGGAGSAPFHDFVSVLNIGSVPLRLALYSADAATTSNGQFAVKLQHDKQQDVGSWITLGKGPTLTLPGRTAAGPARVLVPFSVSIPRNATPGDHVGAILVSLRTAAGTSGRANEALDHRVGIRVYVRVSGTVHAALSIEQLQARFGPQLQANPFGTGHMTVSYVVRNTGNVILGASQELAVSGLFGASSSVTVPAIAPLLPGDSVREHAVVTGVFPELRETTKVTLHPLAQVGAADASLTTVSSSTSTWAVPWLLILLLIIVIAAGTWYLRRRLTSGGAHSKRPAVATRRPAAAGKGGAR